MSRIGLGASLELVLNMFRHENAMWSAHLIANTLSESILLAYRGSLLCTIVTDQYL